VKWSIDRFREKSIGRSALAPVTEVVVVDENHVRVSTAEPFAPLLRTFSYSTIGIYSKGAHEEIGDDEEFSRHPVGPGPFEFVEWIPGQRMLLRAFDDYWAGRPQVDTLEFRTILDEASRIAALEAGEVDVIHAFSPTELQRLERNDEIAVYNPPSAGFIRLNMNTMRPPFDDVRVRQAVAYALNREEIAEGLFLGQAPLAKSLVPSEAVGYTDEFDVYEYDPERARELLQEAGVRDLTFEFAYGSGRYLLDSEVATLVQAQLSQVGIRVNIVPMEWAQFSEYIRQPVDEARTNMTLTWWRTVNGDPDSAIGIFTERELPPAGNNVPYYVSEEFERLYRAQQVETDEQERLEQIRDLQQVLMEGLPAIPMYNQPQLWAARANVVGFQEAITPLSTMKPLHEVHFGD
jgi:peptide/nickel transport system substrate-binding protein